MPGQQALASRPATPTDVLEAAGRLSRRPGSGITFSCFSGVHWPLVLARITTSWFVITFAATK